MTESELLETKVANPKPMVLVLGVAVGALMGLGAAYLFLQRAERENRSLSLSPAEGIKLGLVALGAMKQFAQLGGEK
jgi:hypothetical protein